jgi:ABC-type multidrug transport system ATPase subunit/pSer/pThr/pTyr-binding forkhead associated (FHA) protein
MSETPGFISLADQRSFSLTGSGPWIMGRGATADFQFEDPYSSRQQVRILRDGNGFAAEPLSQSTPTLINDRPIGLPVQLTDNDVLAFGSVRLVFRLSNRDEAATMMGSRHADPAATVFGSRQADAVPAGAAPKRIQLDRDVAFGRSPGGDGVVLVHPTVSRRHAVIRRIPGGYEIRDLGSANGTFVNGRTVTGTQRLVAGDRIDIGPYSFNYDGNSLDSESRQGKIELDARDVSVDVQDLKSGKPLRILDRVSLDIRPRQFVAIVGTSGSGKSTLMGVLSARRPASEGIVTLSGLDLYTNFEALKQDISFVPQNDILHEQLTLRQALDYAAQLRLPPDLTSAARAEIVEQAAASVDLTARLDIKISTLSGGQKKRASLACEILNRPSLLFLDEVTSGLDESTDREIMRLLRKLADDGMTIVCVTHTLTNIEEFCDRAITMAAGGVLVFDGSPKAALKFFGVGRLGQVFDRLQEEGVEEWRARFEQQRAPLADNRGPRASAGNKREQPREQLTRAFHQFTILLNRGTRLLLADRRNLLMAATQCVVIGSLIGLAFANFGEEFQQTPSTVALLMLLGLASLWLGCNGASKEIVGELAIYQRERDVNLSTGAYVLSKFVVAGAFTVIQLAAVLILTDIFAERLPGTFAAQVWVLSLASLLGTAMGLLISAAANTRDQANTVVPMALVPQLILSGSLVPNLPKWIDALAQTFISAYWITETMVAVAVSSVGQLKQFDIAKLSHLLSTGRAFDPSRLGEVPRETHSVALGVLLLTVHTVFFLAATYAVTFLRHRRRA